MEKWMYGEKVKDNVRFSNWGKYQIWFNVRFFPLNKKIPNMIQRMNFYHWTTKYIFPLNNEIHFSFEQQNTKYNSTYQFLQLNNKIHFSHSTTQYQIWFNFGISDIKYDFVCWWFSHSRKLAQNTCTPQRDFVSRSGQETGDFVILRSGQEDRKEDKRDQVRARIYNIHIYKIERKVKI